MHSLGDYFHFPDSRYSKSEPYVQKCQAVTVRYGNLMAAFLVFFVLCIPVTNSLRANRYWLFNRIHILRATNTALDRLVRRSIISEALAARTRKLANVVYLSYGTAFQIGLWCSVFIGMCSVNICGGDLIFLSRRLGRMCVVSLPTVFFLTLQPSPLPRTLYLSLLPIHKWLSRVIVVLAVVHTVIYCIYFVRNNTVAKAWKPANLFGWVGLTGFILIALTSLLRVRDRAYKVFFLNHYFGSWMLVLCLPFHIRPVNTTYANIANVAILSYQVFNRLRMTLKVSEPGDMRIIDVSPNMAVIEFPNLWIKVRANNPGAHIRITNWHPNFIVRLFKSLIPNSHPYTLVTLPLDRYQRLVVRKSSFLWHSNSRYITYGTFDPKLLFIDSSNSCDQQCSISKWILKAKKLLIVVGGSAISFAIPILRVANYHGIPIKVVWILRDYRDLAVLKCFDGFIHGDEFEIFVTGGTGAERRPSVNSKPSYGTFKSAGKYLEQDLEQNETAELLSVSSAEDHHQELESVDVDFVKTENDGCISDCQKTLTMDCGFHDTVFSGSYSEYDYSQQQAEQSLSHNAEHSAASRKSSTSGFNEEFVPHLDSSNPRDLDYTLTIKGLHLEHRIYLGRPVLNFRYYNWCIAANDTFTQCSGPVMDEDSNLVCCKDLPGRLRVAVSEQQKADLGKVWVISAGPKSLVKNMRLWVNENGFKYHEEAFYV
ncbi:hypothetical protein METBISCDRAFT_20891 [Metschnikowia bicuspidata]|uniref:Ferric oxidoreductase domain-containing protein n=1 Tax=Metschnikowia bicuspidata TaxID=27322 RepID=A0A4P9ZIK7_9ASCO|nr:hypothetical protein METBISCDRAFT_20891 [Metschnikowia bicuspidata]